jgi:hypothetical protein
MPITAYFRDRDRVDPGAIGQDHAACAQHVQREGVEPGIDRRDPVQARPSGLDRLSDQPRRLHVDPGDLCLANHRLGFVWRCEPDDIEVLGEVRF